LFSTLKIKISPHYKLIALISTSLILTLLTWNINRATFREINSLFQTISQPNEKLEQIKAIQTDVSTFMYLDRIETISNQPTPSEKFEAVHQEIRSKIHQLKLDYKTNNQQYTALEEIDSILETRHNFFEKYLKIRYNFLKNGILDKQLEGLAQQIEIENKKVDTNVIRSENTIIKKTETQQELEKERKWNLFRKKKKTESQPIVQVEETVTDKIDTFTISKRNDEIIEHVKKSFDEIGGNQSFNQKFIQKQELLLIQTNSLLLERLYGLLQNIESDENRNSKSKIKKASLISNDALNKTKNITILLIICTLILVGILIWDIQKMNSYRLKIEKAKEEADFHSQSKQRFLSNMSHEIRTPLQTIVGFSELLKSDKSDDEKRKLADSLGIASKHLLQIVNEILDYSKIISGKFSIENKPFELEKLIFDLDNTYRVLCEEKGLNWILEYNSEGVKSQLINSDSFRLKQILLNILSNAFKFTETGFIRLKVHLDPEKELLMIEIEDTGEGIEESEIPLIFNQFEQAKSSKKHSIGTGLGLSIVQNLISLMKGEIQVKSIKHQGTLFKIQLPIEISNLTVEKTDEITIKLPEFEGECWFVDDDVLIQKLYMNILDDLHIKYKIFHSAEDLLNVGEIPNNVSQIYIDLRLTGMSGIELSTILLKDLNYQGKIVLVTAQAFSEDIISYYQQGIQTVLSKPFQQKDIIDELFNVEQKHQEFDVENLRKMIPDTDEMNQIIIEFSTESLRDIFQLYELVKSKKQEKDLSKIQLLIHRLAGRFSQFGSKTLAKEFRKLEERMLNQSTVLDEEIYTLLVQAIQTLKKMRIENHNNDFSG
jgi:signal transduction histidine kinase/FixJ family two-component response regulator